LLGQKRICQLADNTRYFRRKLVDMGFIVYGNQNSPVVPMLLYLPARVTCFNREMLRRGFALVTVGFPATKLLEARVRFCISSAHTRQMLDAVRFLFRQLKQFLKKSLFSRLLLPSMKLVQILVYVIQNDTNIDD